MSAWFNRVVLSQSGGGRLKHGNVEQRTTDDLTLNKGSIKRRYILKKKDFSPELLQRNHRPSLS